MPLLHFSHDHPLILREEVDTNGGHDMFCYGCHKPIVPLSTSLAIPNDDAYICGDATCDAAFYLHKKCAQLSKQIQHPMHDRHPLTLQARPPYTCGNSFKCLCSICNREWEWFTYSCLSCQFDVCMTCLFENRSLQHAGHGQHTLSLKQREALLHCDACGTEAKDSSYVCNECEFWMHKTCAFTPKTLEAGGHHRHPLVLLYSLPDIHRTFYEFCRICNKTMHPNRWLYYCDKCTYFVHIKCIATTRTSGEAETQEDIDEHDLLRFPVHSKESFIDLITEQFSKRNINLKKGIAASDSYPGARINHWSHKDHPLTLLEELVQSEVEIICNGCIQTITTSTSHPYYGCIKCNFFLHAFCLDLPLELPAGPCSHHPEHPLVLRRTSQIFFGVKCNACGLVTNGFYYSCGKCNIMFDIRCCFLPIRIKHQSHNHPLLHSASSDSNCDACNSRLAVDKMFKCERNCSSGFQIHKSCALLPGTMRHRWDTHPIHLIYPPFDHQGQVYCEICEDEINTNLWLYHCYECDHSFHTFCLRRRINFKVGDYELVPGLHKHKITLIDKKKHEHHRPFLCSSCNMDFGNYRSVFECVNCDVLFCVKCVSSHL